MTTSNEAAPCAQDAANDDEHGDSWQPVGRIVRKIARDLSIPTPTVVAVLEANGIEVTN